MSVASTFHDRLQEAWSHSGSLICVGLDPVRNRLPATFRESPTGLRDFCCAIAEATADLVCAFKPQAAHFAAEGAEDQLASVIAFIQQRWPEVPVILDAKRSDIGATAELYAKEVFERYNADAVTINPYLGEESIRPFLGYAGRGVALLCRTSNAGSGWLQTHPPEAPLYLRVAAAAKAWNRDRNLMLVAGATHPDELAQIRQAVGDMPLLVPGIGAQGGDLAQVLQAGLDGDGQGLIINASRSVLYAGTDDSAQFEKASRDAALALWQEVNALRDVQAPAAARNQ
ncbi:MAG: orotidine-5'-phosphate decarboxylase [Gammaproteobacteria bacterium]|nr:orotidine-5'-phosphate decarboxylase [Gammaproteobacteria bacterium]